MLPTFAGIGAPRSGTTWLSALLAAHPQVAMPRHRKELHYLDRHHARGLDWYRSRFPPPGDHPPVAVGEFTTHYLYDPQVPVRARDVPGLERFVLLVRNPVDRAWSHYRFRCRQDRFAGSFEAFLAVEPRALVLGRYAEHLAAWTAELEAGQLLVLVFEQAVAHPPAATAALGRHLGVDPAGFPAALAPVNESFRPQRSWLYAAAVGRARWLRDHDLDGVVSAARRLGLGRAVSARAPEPPERLDAALRARLWEGFAPDVERLGALTGLDLSGWAPPPS